MLVWRKPEILTIDVNDLLCKVKLKAGSADCNSGQYAEENACPELSVGDTWGDGGEGVDAPCGIFTQCIEVGPLFGCNEGTFYCSSLMSALK